MTNLSPLMPREVAYRWLAQFFLRPLTGADLEGYNTADGRAFLANCKGQPALAELAKTIEAAVGSEQNLDKLAGQYSDEFSRMFDQGGPRAALPYASVFLSERGLLYQGPAHEMNAILADLSMSLPETLREPADHLAIQLQVAAELAAREGSGQSAPIALHDFLTGQLLTWLPAFVERCAKRADSGLIPVAAKAALALVESDLAQGS